MGQTLTHGVYLPDEGERNCYSGLAANWQILDTSVGTIAAHTSALAGKAPLVHTHTKSDITDFPAYGNTAGTICEGNDSRLSDARTPVAHTHVTADVTDLLNGNHTWTANQFLKNTAITDYKANPSADTYIGWTFRSNENKYWGGITHNYFTTGVSEVQIAMSNWTTSGSQGYWHLDFGATKDFSNVYFRPSSNNNVNLGSSSNQWNNLYAKNYFYNGTAWGLDKNNWWSKAQFYAQNSIHVRNVEPGVAPSSDVTAGIRVENANATYAFADIIGRVLSSGTTFVNLVASNKFSNGALDPNGTTVSRGLQVGIRSDSSGFIYTECGWRNSLVPYFADMNLNLGTPTNKWKTLNGINPGALSLPDYAHPTSLDVSAQGLNWHTDTTPNFYEVPANGYFAVIVQCPTVSYGVLDIFVNNTGIGSSDHGTYAGNELFCCVPVLQGQIVRVRARCDNYYSVTFYPCLGNV